MILLGLILLAVPFVLPIVVFVANGRLRLRLDVLEEMYAGQQRSLDEITKQLREHAEEATAAAVTTAALVSPRLFWGALAIAVIVLLGLIARLIKKPAAAGQP